MKKGCLENALFALLLLIGFGASSYFWFNFFIKGKSVSTPNLVGKSVNDAKALCSDLGLTLTVDETHRRNHDKVPAGFVVWQNKAPGSTNFIKRGSAVRVELSAGPLVLRVPELSGQTPRTALLRLSQQNLKLGNLVYAEAAKSGVVSEEPPVDTVVGAQTPVSLLVGVAPQPVTYVMPDLIDQPLDAVRPSLDARHLTVATVKFEAYPGIRDGIIIRQFPLRGAPISAHDAISVVVTREEPAGMIQESPKPEGTSQK
jgi:beta-lactam-binding protein with PASTA domain